MDKNTMLFIHGYGTTHGAAKFKALKKYFESEFEVQIMEWDESSDISFLMNEFDVKLDSYENPIIIGDSTGANFAYQLKERRKRKNKDTVLILTCPLLVDRIKISVDEISELFKGQLKEYSNPTDALILATPDDEVLDETWLWEKEWENIKLVKIEDGHTFDKFGEYLHEFDTYIKNCLVNREKV